MHPYMVCARRTSAGPSNRAFAPRAPESSHFALRRRYGFAGGVEGHAGGVWVAHLAGNASP